MTSPVAPSMRTTVSKAEMLGGADCRNCGEYASTVPVMRMAAIAATTGARLHIEWTRGGSFRIVNALAASVVRDTAGFSGTAVAAQTATWLRVWKPSLLRICST